MIINCIRQTKSESKYIFSVVCQKNLVSFNDCRKKGKYMNSLLKSLINLLFTNETQTFTPLQLLKVKLKNKLFINNNIFLHEELSFNCYIGYNKKSKNNHQITLNFYK